MRFTSALFSVPLRFNILLQARHNRRFHESAALLQPEGSGSGSGNWPKKDETDDFYALLLSSPLPTTTTTITSTPTANALDLLEASTPAKSVPLTPRVIFGSRLAGPAAREKEGWADSRPKEPDNCCMSGCVNCVWDAYREEVEEWAARLKQKHTQGQVDDGKAKIKSKKSKISSNDGGGIGDLDGMAVGDGNVNDFFKDLPVGIREFIAMEKRLKEGKSMHGDGGPG